MASPPLFLRCSDCPARSGAEGALTPRPALQVPFTLVLDCFCQLYKPPPLFSCCSRFLTRCCRGPEARAAGTASTPGARRGRRRSWTPAARRAGSPRRGCEECQRRLQLTHNYPWYEVLGTKPARSRCYSAVTSRLAVGGTGRRPWAATRFSWTRSRRRWGTWARRSRRGAGTSDSCKAQEQAHPKFITWIGRRASIRYPSIRNHCKRDRCFALLPTCASQPRREVLDPVPPELRPTWEAGAAVDVAWAMRTRGGAPLRSPHDRSSGGSHTQVQCDR